MKDKHKDGCMKEKRRFTMASCAKTTDTGILIKWILSMVWIHVLASIQKCRTSPCSLEQVCSKLHKWGMISHWTNWGKITSFFVMFWLLRKIEKLVAFQESIPLTGKNDMFQNNCNLFYLGCFQEWIHDAFQVGLSYKTKTARGSWFSRKRQTEICRSDVLFIAGQTTDSTWILLYRFNNRSYNIISPTHFADWVLGENNS